MQNRPFGAAKRLVRQCETAYLARQKRRYWKTAESQRLTEIAQRKGKDVPQHEKLLQQTESHANGIAACESFRQKEKRPEMRQTTMRETI